MKDYNSAVKTVAGNEGDKCNYPTRLDTYGCGCQHDCKYCYAKSLLEFRELWNPKQPSVAKVSDISKQIRKLKQNEVIRLGGMTDCFQPMEKLYRNTYKAIKLLNRRKIPYLIIKKQFDIDYSEYTIKQSGYQHLPLKTKIKYLQDLDFKEMSVCEDETEAYEYWKNNFNHNPNDCCNLRK